MRLGDLLAELGHPVAYFPRLAQVVRGVTPGLFLAQLCYWHGKQADPDGWIRKSAREMEDETGMVRSEQQSARRVLRLLQVVHERLRGVPATVEYQINFDRLQALWNAGPPVQTSLPDPANQFAETCKPVCSILQTSLLDPANSLKESETTSENTSETTQIVRAPLRGTDELDGERITVSVHRKPHPIPQPYPLSDALRTYAADKGCGDPVEGHAAFVDYWVASGKRKASWPATERTWVRNSHGPAPRFPCSCRGGAKGDGLSQSMRNVRAVAAKYRAEGRL